MFVSYIFQENAPYGTKVIDMCDFHVLDVSAGVWLGVDCALPDMRGGVNALAYCEKDDQWILSGELIDYQVKVIV